MVLLGNTRPQLFHSRYYIPAVYNILDDLVNDGVDAMERELLRLARSLEAAGKGRPGAARPAAASDAAGVETDMQAEIVAVRRSAKKRRYKKRTLYPSGVLNSGALHLTLSIDYAADGNSLSSQGADELARALLDAHEVPGDKFFLFAMRNVFMVPAELRDDVEEALVGGHV